MKLIDHQGERFNSNSLIYKAIEGQIQMLQEEIKFLREILRSKK